MSPVPYRLTWRNYYNFLVLGFFVVACARSVNVLPGKVLSYTAHTVQGYLPSQQVASDGTQSFLKVFT